MKIFHEIYSNYFRIASEILKFPEITKEDKNKIISRLGFSETSLYIPDDLWGLLKKNNSGNYIPVIKNKPVSVLTEIQKRWIKAKLESPKINLFLEKDIINSLKKCLENVKPLYSENNFRYTDRFSDGDNFSDVNYQENFRKIISAVKMHEIIEINFNSRNNQKISGLYVPVKIQYSPKNNRFRILAFSVQKDRTSIINIGRITDIKNTGEIFHENISVERYFSEHKCQNPVTVRISTERNATERFFMEFAPYEKRTEYDSETGVCMVQLWYDRLDETELLIRLLSFGAVIEIVSPPEFRRKAKERIDRQYELLHKKTPIIN
ncbi:MAG: WYL domain-containing protein [Prevotella sp.]|nr:WYL domain-containing protein [Alistipes senegalensis]MCM1358873.1 WYL domain-containing protein [Prevotella sp.]